MRVRRESAAPVQTGPDCHHAPRVALRTAQTESMATTTGVRGTVDGDAGVGVDGQGPQVFSQQHADAPIVVQKPLHIIHGEVNLSR